MNKQVDKFSWIRNLSVIMGIIFAIGSLYVMFNPKEPKLYAKCKALDIPETPLENEFFENNRYNAIPLKFSSSSRYFMQCEIMNNGDREASDIKFVLPNNILSIKYKTAAVDVGFEKDVIKINSLRPETHIELDIWAKGNAPQQWNTLQLNSKEVSGKVYIGKVYYGIIATIAGIISSIDKIFLILLIPSLFLIYLLTSSIREEYKSRIDLEKEKCDKNDEID